MPESMPEENTVIQDSTTIPTAETTPGMPPIEGDVRVEEFKISGNELVAKVKELLHEGNIRRVILKTEDGNTLIEIPLTVGIVGGLVGTALFPVVAALGAIGALVAHVTLVIEKKVS